MSAAEIEAGFCSISVQKDDLKKSFEDLQSCSSSSSASFTLQWKDVDDYISFTEKSLRKRFQELKASGMLLEIEKPAASASLPAVVAREDINPEVDPRPGLKFPCIKMNANALRLCILDIHEDVETIRRELGRALLLAPDPVTLVLDFLEESNSKKKIRFAALSLLEVLHELAPEIKPSAKERARRTAEKCKMLINTGLKKENLNNVLIFLNLIAIFGLVEFLVVEDVLGLLVLVAAVNHTVDLCRNPLFEAKVPDLIEELCKVGRQMDALKFVISFDLFDKYPVGYIFNTYINHLKQIAQHMTKGRPPHFRLKAITKQIYGLQAVIKAVEKYNLESLYPCDSLHKQINKLETQRFKFKEGFTKNDPSKWNNMGKEWRHQRSNKRPRPSDPAPPQPQPPNQPQLGLVDRAPFALPNPYALNSGPSLYIHDGVSLPVNPFGLGGPVFPQNSYPYPAGAPAGPAHHDMVMAHGGYPMPGFPFNPSHHHP